MLIAWALLLLELRPAVAITTAPRAPHRAAAPLRLARTAAPPALAADDDDDKVAAALETIKDAGIAGVASYFTVEVSFFAIALPIGYVVYHGTTGEWLQLQDLLSDGEGRVRLPRRPILSGVPNARPRGRALRGAVLRPLGPRGTLYFDPVICAFVVCGDVGIAWRFESCALKRGAWRQ